MTTDITNIPLNKLTAWERNVRKTQTKGIDELAASIDAHGLLQSLVVRKDGKKFAVVAGNRRLAALAALLKAGKIDAGFEVPCQVIENNADATEISLAENTQFGLVGRALDRESILTSRNIFRSVCASDGRRD
jgi:ParB family transcriptional regulator, chromosome partitioning protein